MNRVCWRWLRITVNSWAKKKLLYINVPHQMIILLLVEWINYLEWEEWWAVKSVGIGEIDSFIVDWLWWIEAFTVCSSLDRVDFHGIYVELSSNSDMLHVLVKTETKICHSQKKLGDFQRYIEQTVLRLVNQYGWVQLFRYKTQLHNSANEKDI